MQKHGAHLGLLVWTVLVLVCKTNANSGVGQYQAKTWKFWTCNCNDRPKECYGNGACGTWEYCSNIGEEFFQERAFICGPCSRGTYYKKVSPLQSYQTVKTMPRTEEQRFCPSNNNVDYIDFTSGDWWKQLFSPPEKDCYYATVNIPGSEETLQGCQQCPIFTVVNPVDPISLDIFRGENTQLATAAQQETRCFTSCFLAWKSDKNTKNTISIKVLNSRSMIQDDNSFDIFTEIDSDRTVAEPPILLRQSSIGFSVSAKEWLDTDEAKVYKAYITANQRHKRITTLPAPRRSCRICPDGTTLLASPVLKDGKLNKEDLQETIDNIKMVKDFLLKGIDPPTGFSHEISWLNSDLIYDFNVVEVCQSCPAGTFFDKFRRDLTKYTVNSKARDALFKLKQVTNAKMIDKWTLSQLRCHPCDDGFYRSAEQSVFECQICEEETFTLLNVSTIKIQMTPGAQYELKETLLATTCAKCPGGSERKTELPCSSYLLKSENQFSILPKNDCCAPCGVNLYKPEGMKVCIDVPSDMATEFPFGNTKVIRCVEGTELRGCMEKRRDNTDRPFALENNYCLRTDTAEDDDWRVCLPCTAIERPLMDNNEARCLMCNGEDDEVPRGEFYNTTTKKCEACDECKVFEPEVVWRAFLHDKEGYQNAIEPWYNENNFKFRVRNRWHYKHFNIKCNELRRRRLLWNAGALRVDVEGEDRVKTAAAVRWKGQLHGDGPVAALHAVDYELFANGTRRCEVKRCEAFCEMRYMYSQGCGAGAATAELWARKAEGGIWRVQKLQALGAQALAAASAVLAGWELKHHGHCVECKVCSDHRYNRGCNRFGGPDPPEGTCELCATQCEGAQFLWHEEGLRGCFPLAAERRGRVLANYVCRRCPTWVQNTSGIYAVLGCGGKETFEWWEPVPLGFKTKTLTKDEALAKRAAEHPDVDVKFKPFYHLGAYCPNGHFFDTEAPGCKFEPESGFRLHRAEMSFGYDVFKLDCCRLCELCDVDKYRMTALYRPCTGETVRDTQAQACGDRCESGFYVRNESALECVACGEC